MGVVWVVAVGYGDVVACCMRGVRLDNKQYQRFKLQGILRNDIPGGVFCLCILWPMNSREPSLIHA